VFGDFAQCGFEGLDMVRRIEDLLAKGDRLTAWGLLDFSEFGINDRQGLCCGGDLGRLSLELGQESL
jgi:hypothetical protein